MITQPKIDKESNAVLTHLQIMQSIINRLASNSASCKTWCITLVSAMFVLIADKGGQSAKIPIFYITMLPIGLFCFLDVYYLGMEKSYRDKYNEALANIDSNFFEKVDLFHMRPSKENSANFLAALYSPSVWPFYSVLAIASMLIHMLT